MVKLELPFWMKKGELAKLKNASQEFWQLVEKWFSISLSQFDLLTCDLTIVDYVAWQRKIQRLDGEIESVYRKRVNYAFINAQDAGMTRGIYNIFKRLGINVIDIREREPGRDWDIIILELDDYILSDYKELVTLLIDTYGATCRRYDFSVTKRVTQYQHVGSMAWKHQTNVAIPSFIAYGNAYSTPYIISNETAEVIVHGS